MPSQNSNPSLCGSKSTAFSMTWCDDVVSGLLWFPCLVGIGEDFKQGLPSSDPASFPPPPLGPQWELPPSYQLSLPSCLTSQMVTPRHAWRVCPYRMGSSVTKHSLEGQILVFLLHDQAVFSNWARAFVILHQLWTLNRGEKVGHLGTGFPLCQQSAIILTSFVWYKWEGDKCRVPARVY